MSICTFRIWCAWWNNRICNTVSLRACCTSWTFYVGTSATSTIKPYNIRCPTDFTSICKVFPLISICNLDIATILITCYWRRNNKVSWAIWVERICASLYAKSCRKSRNLYLISLALRVCCNNESVCDYQQTERIFHAWNNIIRFLHSKENKNQEFLDWILEA